MKKQITMPVTLNGTDTNPFHRLGFKMNPFPQIADARYDAGERILRELAAEPIPDVEYIRQKLAGFSQEFIDLCCQNYRKGETVKFDVTFPDDL